MNILRTILRQLASNGFRLCIITLAIVCAFTTTFGTPQKVKDAFKGSGIYPAMSDEIVARASDTHDNQAAQSALQQPEVQDAAKAAFTPAYLQASTDEVIDGTYHWLQGKTAKPDFRVDLTPAVTAVENKAADSAAARVKQLPPCTLQELRAINPATVDPYKLTCLPPGFNVDNQRQAFIDSLSGSNDFLKNPIVTADSIPKNSKGQTVFEQASAAPKVFKWLMVAPWILGGLAALLAVVVILLHNSRRRGARSLAVSIAVNGLLLLIVSFLTGYLFGHYFGSGSKLLNLHGNASQQAVVNIVKALDNSISHSLLIFGGAYLAVGLVALLALRLTKPMPDPATPSDSASATDNPLSERRAMMRDDK